MEILNSLPKYALFGSEQDYKNAKVVAIPIPYDSTVTFRSGTREGPRAIIEASRNMEGYAYELDRSIDGLVYTTDEMAQNIGSPEKMVEQIKKEVVIVLDDGKIPFLLGGEHTITLGALNAFKETKKDVSVIQFDAHTDMRDEFLGSRYMHATVMKRARDAFPVFQLGLRSTHERPEKKDKKTMLFMDEMHKMSAKEVAGAVSKSTGKDIYLTIDLDVLDPSEMPSVGTPEPDGMRFREIVEIVKELSKSKRLAGMDMVELNPIPGVYAPNYTAAKLAYLCLGFFLK